MKKTSRAVLGLLAGSLLVAPSAMAQIIVTGAANTLSGVSPSSISQAFTIGAGSDVLVAAFADADGTENSLPSTLTFTPTGGGSSITLNQVLVQFGANNTYRNAVIYDAVVNNSTSLAGTITGSLDSSARDYQLSTFSLAGVDNTVPLITGSTNGANNGASTDTVTLDGLPAGGLAVLASGIGQTQLNGGSVTLQTYASGTTTPEGNDSNTFYNNGPNSNTGYLNGYVTGLPAGNTDFTLTASTPNNTQYKWPEAVVDFTAETPEPSTFALVLASMASLAMVLRLRRRLV